MGVADFIDDRIYERLLEIVVRIAMRGEGLKLDNENPTEIIAGFVVEFTGDVDDLPQLRDERQPLLQLVQGQGMNTREIGKEVVVEHGEPPVGGELHVDFDHASAQRVRLADGGDRILSAHSRVGAIWCNAMT